METLVSVAQVAVELGVTPCRVRALIKAGRLRAHKPWGRDWAIQASDVDAVRVRRPGRPRNKFVSTEADVEITFPEGEAQ